LPEEHSVSDTIEDDSQVKHDRSSIVGSDDAYTYQHTESVLFLSFCVTVTRLDYNFRNVKLTFDGFDVSTDFHCGFIEGNVYASIVKRNQLICHQAKQSGCSGTLLRVATAKMTRVRENRYHSRVTFILRLQRQSLVVPDDR